MKKITFIFVLLLTFSANADDKQIIATVDGKKITRGDLEGELAQLAEMVENGAPKLESFPKDFQKEFINKYIDKVLIVQAAKKAGAHKSPEIRKKLQEAEDYLSQQKYLTSLVVNQKNDKALREIYDEKIGSTEPQLEVHASHILVEKEEKAKDIKKQLDGGADFEELAKNNSIEPGAKVGAGDLGYFVKEQMVPDFSVAAFELKAGDISEPVKTDFGWHIIKLHDKRKRKEVSFDEARPALENEFARRVIDSKVAELRKKAKIEVKVDFDPAKKKAEVKPKAKAKKKVAAKSKKKATTTAKVEPRPKIKAATKVEKKTTDTAKVEEKVEKANEATLNNIEAAAGKEE